MNGVFPCGAAVWVLRAPAGRFQSGAAGTAGPACVERPRLRAGGGEAAGSGCTRTGGALRYGRSVSGAGEGERTAGSRFKL